MGLLSRISSDSLARKLNRLYYEEVDRIVNVRLGQRPTLELGDVLGAHRGAFERAVWEVTPRRYRGTGWSPLGDAHQSVERSLLRGFASPRGFSVDDVLDLAAAKDSYRHALEMAEAGDGEPLEKWYRDHPGESYA